MQGWACWSLMLDDLGDVRCLDTKVQIFWSGIQGKVMNNTYLTCCRELIEHFRLEKKFSFAWIEDPILLSMDQDIQ